MTRVLIILPENNYDPSEMAIPAKTIKDAGFELNFATPNGDISLADEIMISGQGLDIWGNIPLFKKLIFIGAILRANKNARDAYNEVIKYREFKNPIKYENINPNEYDALIIPGGHKADGMAQFLENEILKNVILNFNCQNKIIGAICHGPLLLARTIDPQTTKSVVYNKKLTALPWELEKTANQIANFTRFWDKNYYRTYVEKDGQEYGFMGVENEIKRLIGSENFQLPKNDFKKSSGMFRDSPNDYSASFIVRDENIISARWPGDSYAFANAIVNALLGRSV